MSVYDDFRKWIGLQATNQTNFPNLGGQGGGFSVVAEENGNINIKTLIGRLLPAQPKWIDITLKRMIDCGDTNQRLMTSTYGNNWPGCPSLGVCPYLASLAAHYLELLPNSAVVEDNDDT